MGCYVELMDKIGEITRSESATWFLAPEKQPKSHQNPEYAAPQINIQKKYY